MRRPPARTEVAPARGNGARSGRSGAGLLRAAALPFACVLLTACVLATSCSIRSERADTPPSITSPARPSTEDSGSGRATPGQATDDPTDAADTGRDGIPDGWSAPPLTWSTCPEATHAQCATLAVPLDWSDPTGPTIELALARLPATGPRSARLGTIVVNPGGPGGSGVDFVASDPLSSGLSRRFDKVGWDPRGVGGSTAATCGEATSSEFLAADPDPDTPAEQERLDRLARAVSSDCRSDADLLAHVGTRNVARDLEAIRRALDDGPLNYLGFSYGTQIGQYYAEMFPRQVRAMVLDGVVDPSVSFTAFLDGQIDGFDASFDASAAACRRAGTRRCGVADLAEAYDRVHEQVERRPLVLDDGRSIGPADVTTAAIATAYTTDGWRDLGPALADALAGDGEGVAGLADRYHDLGGYGTYAGVVCTDTPPPASPEAWRRFADEARTRSPRFGGSVANELLPCATWPVRSRVAPAPVTAPGAPPILVVGNTGDPATPLANSRAVAAALESGVLVTVDMAGHTAYGADTCATGVIDRYLTDITVPADGTAC